MENTPEKKQKEQLPGLEGIEVQEKPKVKTHPAFGVYKDVTVVPLMQIDMKNTGYAGINAYSVDYKYNVKQNLPELVIQFIEERTQVHRSYVTRFDEDKRPYEEMVVEYTPRFNVIRH